MSHRSSRGIAAVAAMLALTAAPASAQWTSTGVGVVEWDTNETLLLLAGVSMGPSGPGVRPFIGVQGYRLTYDAGPTLGNTNVTAVRPYVGLRNNYGQGSAAISVGYAFTNREVDSPPATFVADRGDGVVLSGQVDHWGTGQGLGYQWLGSYNFGSESLWTRGRVTTRLAEAGLGQIRVGGEVAYMTSGGSSAWQPGAVLEWHTGNERILAFGVGRKLVEQGDDATFFRVEVVLPIIR